MQIIESPQEVAKIEGHTKQLLNAPDVILRAVSLLKKTINENWISAPVAQADKENIPQNAGDLKKQMTPEIAEADKNYVRSRIISAMEVAVAQLQNK